MRILDIACGISWTSYPPDLCTQLHTRGYQIAGVDRYDQKQLPFEYHHANLVKDPESLQQLGDDRFDMVLDRHFSGGNIYPELLEQLRQEGLSIQLLQRRLEKIIGRILRPRGVYIRSGGIFDQLYQKQSGGLLYIKST